MRHRTGVADLAVGRLSEQELAEFRKHMEATLPLVSGNHFVGFERYVEENTAFHEYLVGLAKLAVLCNPFTGWYFVDAGNTVLLARR